MSRPIMSYLCDLFFIFRLIFIAINHITLLKQTYLFFVHISALVGERPMKSLLSVCRSVRLSLSFLKIGSLVFSDIVHDGSWTWHLVNDRARFLKKSFWQPEFEPKWPKSGPNLGFFCHFLKFGFLVFYEISYNGSLQQCLTCSRGKIHEKKLRAQIWAKGAKIRPKTRFFVIFFQFCLLVFLELACNDSLQQCLTSNRGKIQKKKFWGPNLGQRSQNQAQNEVFCHFIKFGSLVFLEGAYNDSLQQCVTSCWGKIHKKNFWGPNLGQRGQSQTQN